jgi:hypothetical protein
VSYPSRWTFRAAQQICGKRIPTAQCNVVNVVQYLRDFEMNFGRQREGCILVAEEKIIHENENQPRTSTQCLANHVGVSQFV